MRRAPWFLALVVVVTVVAAACGGGDGSGGGGNASTGLPPEETLQRAADGLSSADSFRVRLDGQIEAAGEDLRVPLVSSLPGGRTKLNGEGAVARPDRASLDVDVDVGPIPLPASVVRVGDDLYLSAFGQNLQLDVPVEEVRRLDPGLIAGTALGWIQDPREAGSESREGVETVRIEGAVDGQAITADLGGLLGANALPNAISTGTVQVWVGVDDLLLRRILVRYQASTGDEGGSRGTLDLVLDLDLFDYGAEVTITPPTGARRVTLDDLPGLIGG